MKRNSAQKILLVLVGLWICVAAFQPPADASPAAIPTPRPTRITAAQTATRRVGEVASSHQEWDDEGRARTNLPAHLLDDAATEESPLLARNPYAASKIGGDRLAYSYYATFGLPTIVTRCSNNYGPYQHPEKLIPLFVTNALQDLPVPVYGSGRNTRDWIHVDDHCAAMLAILQTKDVEGETFNIGAGNEKSVLEITSLILDQLKKPKTLVKHVSDRPGHDRRYALNMGKLKKKS